MRTSLGWHEPCRHPGAELYRAFGEAEAGAVPLLEQTQCLGPHGVEPSMLRRWVPPSIGWLSNWWILVHVTELLCHPLARKKLQDKQEKRLTLPRALAVQQACQPVPKVEANLFDRVYLEGVGRWRVENPQRRGQKERSFRIGVKEEEEKHRLWGQKGLFPPCPD